jgi:hypothetical protein
VEIGQDVAVGADDDSRAESGIALLLAFRPVAEEMAEDRVVEQRVALLLDFLCRVDVHHRGQGGARRFAVGAGRRLVLLIGGRCFLQGDDGLPLRQPFRFERRDDEQNGQRNGHRLCKNQPQPVHGKSSR